eukprot:m.104452 g.104452  ORF g.104452 m.104452 type:complete len:776 (+) comp37204_c0_seq7:86-2413(+)
MSQSTTADDHRSPSVTKGKPKEASGNGGKDAESLDKKKGKKQRSGIPDKAKSKRAPNQTLEEPFDPYWSEDAISDGLKRGQLLKGVLRINPKNYKDAFMPDPAGGLDIYMAGVWMRNRALNGDVVIVDLLHRSQWKTREIDDENKKRIVQKTGKVVFILEKKHSRAAIGFIKSYDKSDQTAIFSPMDHRLPRIVLPLSDCPPDYLKNPRHFEKTLFVARITDWLPDCPFANGRLARSLGEAGEIEPETEGFLIENGVDFSNFSEEVLDCLPKSLPWKIPKEELANRRDLRKECLFTIDPSTARDLDDALHCRELSDGNYEIGVHIADVSYFVRPETALNDIAFSRATSVYLVQKVIPMLPRMLCEELCSLNPNQDRLAVSVIWTVNLMGEILKEWKGRTVIRSCVKMAYGDAQEIIDNPTKVRQENDFPSVSGHSMSAVAQAVLNLNKIAVHLRKARFGQGSLRLDQPKLTFSLNSETGMPNGCNAFHQKDSNRLVEEFMLLANTCVAKHIHKSNAAKALLRCHPHPDVKLLDDVAKLCSCHGIGLDVKTSLSLQASLQDHVEKIPGERLLLMSLLSRPMKLACYFCAGCVEDEVKCRHYALSIPLYTHFTSPIRRYPDVMVHRLLTASLGIDDTVKESSERMDWIASHCNDMRNAAKRVQEMSSELFFGVFIKECGPINEKGMVSSVLDKAFDVLVLRFGITVRVYCEQLPLERWEHSKMEQKGVLNLVWKDVGQREQLSQSLTVFTPVEVAIEAKKDGLKYAAFLVHPSQTTA